MEAKIFQFSYANEKPWTTLFLSHAIVSWNFLRLEIVLWQYWNIDNGRYCFTVAKSTELIDSFAKQHTSIMFDIENTDWSYILLY